MTEMSGAGDNLDVDGNSLLVENNEKECCFGETLQTKLEFVLISGFEIVNFATEDKNVDFINDIGNKMIPHSITVGKINT